jgi:hypothetical protein
MRVSNPLKLNDSTQNPAYMSANAGKYCVSRRFCLATAVAGP